jgi:hypothetical protein
MESAETDTETTETTTITMAADEYDSDADVATDGRLWLGEDWAGKKIEVAIREKAE